MLLQNSFQKTPFWQGYVVKVKFQNSSYLPHTCRYKICQGYAVTFSHMLLQWSSRRLQFGLSPSHIMKFKKTSIQAIPLTHVVTVKFEKTTLRAIPLTHWSSRRVQFGYPPHTYCYNEVQEHFKVKFKNTPTVTMKFPRVVTVKFENIPIRDIALTHAADMLPTYNSHMLCRYVTHVLDSGYPPHTWVKFENTPTVTVKFLHVVTGKFENTPIRVIPLTHVVSHMLRTCYRYVTYTCCVDM